jgi:hypothetical protein
MAAHREHDIGRAVFYMALAMALLPCLNASAKYLGRDYATIESSGRAMPGISLT